MSQSAPGSGPAPIPLPPQNNVQIRFRSDNWYVSQMRLKGTQWLPALSWITKEEFDAVPLPVPGDIWRINWKNGPVAGYAICCPKCWDIHNWTTATNCAKEPGKDHCSHSGTGSCWGWTGSAEDGTLSAHPSLLCHACGYHGWLKGGVLINC